jgi:ABC-type sugar transport system ATPase subunit
LKQSKPHHVEVKIRVTAQLSYFIFKSNVTICVVGGNGKMEVNMISVENVSTLKEPVLKVNGLFKNFAGLQALSNVNFDIHSHEVHALVGENGAGKSTMIKIIGGIIERDSGEILFNGQQVAFHSPMEAIKAGIAIIHQELSMLPDLNIIENIYMGRMDSVLGRVSWKKLRNKAIEVLERVGLHVDPFTTIKNLNISQRQLVEIAKTISKDAKLIIMDEPNSSLTTAETERLFALIETLKQQGIAIIYVSHKLEEVIRISDRITVLRDGKYIGAITKDEASTDKIIQMMVGRDLHREPRSDNHKSDRIKLDVKNLSGNGFNKISFKVHEGEILGFSGLVGAGRSEVVRAIFGIDKFHSGQINFEGKNIQFRSSKQAIRNGLAIVPEDRKLLSLFMDQSIGFNMSFAQLPKFAVCGLLKHKKVQEIIEDYKNKLDIRLRSFDLPVSSLSGGNQQKVILARWLATKPKLLILDEPTHGIDIGAKFEIYKLIRKLAGEGISIILISSEMPEIISMADRILVMHEGKMTAILNQDEFSEERIMKHATGIMQTDLLERQNQ